MSSPRARPSRACRPTAPRLRARGCPERCRLTRGRPAPTVRCGAVLIVPLVLISLVSCGQSDPHLSAAEIPTANQARVGWEDVLIEQVGSSAVACPVVLQSLPLQCGAEVPLSGVDLRENPDATRIGENRLQLPVHYLEAIVREDYGLDVQEIAEDGPDVATEPEQCNGTEPDIRAAQETQRMLNARSDLAPNVIGYSSDSGVLRVEVVVATPGFVRWFCDLVDVATVLSPVTGPVG